jgi:hypothetical protein
MVQLEFAHYDAARRGTLSPADFGLSLAAAAASGDVTALLARVRALEGADIQPESGTIKAKSTWITPAQFAAFHALLPRLPELRAALTAYDAARGALTPATFASAVRRVCGLELAPSVIAVIFAVFDADGDGTLTPKEFFDVMERRRRLEEGGGAPVSSVGELAACCGACVAAWRAASA